MQADMIHGSWYVASSSVRRLTRRSQTKVLDGYVVTAPCAAVGECRHPSDRREMLPTVRSTPC